MSLLFLLGSLLACAAGPESPEPTPLAQPGVPLMIDSADNLRALDGTAVTLVGTYRKKLSVVGMPRPGRPAAREDLGYAQIELPGAEGTLLLDLGDAPRPAEESASLADRRVAVTGTLELSPPPVTTAASTRPKPRLVSVTSVRPAP